LTLWKDADPDIPILKQAKAEYASCNELLLRDCAGLGYWRAHIWFVAVHVLNTSGVVRRQGVHQRVGLRASIEGQSRDRIIHTGRVVAPWGKDA
jgi:hypothetical protein